MADMLKKFGSAASGLGKNLAAPPEEEAAAIAEKQRMIDEYRRATANQPAAAPAAAAPATAAPVDRVDSMAQYGDRGAEQRINPEELQSMMKPLGSAGVPGVLGMPPHIGAQKPLPSYDEGGDVPEDQLAVVHKDEKVLTPEEADQYDAEHGAPVGFGGPVYPNPKGIQPRLDTESATAPDEPVGAKMQETSAPQPIVKDATMKPLGGPVEPAPSTKELPAAGRKPEEMAQMGAGAGQEEAAAPAPVPTTLGKAMSHEELEQKRAVISQDIEDAAAKGDLVALGKAKLNLLELNKQHPWGSAANHPGFLGKLGHIASMAGQIAGSVVAPGVVAEIPGTDLNRRVREAQAMGEIKEGGEARLSEAEAKQKEAEAGLVDPHKAAFHELMTGGPNGGPKINPATGAPFTAQEANIEAQGTGKTPIELDTQDLMKTINPATGKNFTRLEAHEEAARRLAGTKPLNEAERKIADWMQSHNMEDTPTNRQAAREAIMSREADIKAAVALPYAERKAAFTNKLGEERDRLNQGNVNAYQRGLKADELQQKSDQTYAADKAKIDTAKEALNQSDQSQFAAAISPVITLLSFTSAEGVKRVNKQELDKFLPADGSLGRWVNAHADKWFAGQIPPEYKKEVGQMLDALSKDRELQHRVESESIDGTIRQGAQQPVQKPEGGAKPTPKKSEPKAPAATPTTAAPKAGGFADWKKKQQQPQ